jgi:predicted nucleic acid-binding protein
VAFRAFIDAQILVAARPRDVLLTLAEAGMFEPLWSPLVLEEMERHLPQTMTEPQRVHLLAMMQKAFPEASVEWSGVVDVNVQLAVNAKDRHVVAAAIVGRADVVLTEDQGLFEELHRSGVIDAQKLPEFIAYAIDADQPNARVALLDMAVTRWGAIDRQDAEPRLKAYFARQGWDSGALDAGLRPRRPIPWL